MHATVSASTSKAKPGNAQTELPLRSVSLEKWLGAKEVAAHFGLEQWSAYRWREDGTIPEQFVKRSGAWRLRFHPDIVPLLEKVFYAAHE